MKLKVFKLRYFFQDDTIKHKVFKKLSYNISANSNLENTNMKLKVYKMISHKLIPNFIKKSLNMTQSSQTNNCFYSLTISPQLHLYLSKIRIYNKNDIRTHSP